MQDQSELDQHLCIPVSCRVCHNNGRDLYLQMLDRECVAAVMMIAPTRKTTLEMKSAHFRPTFSVTISPSQHLAASEDSKSSCGILKKQKMAPKKAPAWNVDVILLEMLLASAGEMSKSLLKLARAIVVPMKAPS